MPSDGEIAGELILGLAKRGCEGLAVREAKIRTRIRDRIFRAGRAISEHEIVTAKTLPRRLGRKKVNLFWDSVPGTYIALKPIVKGDELLPYLSVAATADLSQFQLFLLAFTIDANDAVQSIGFRFESPESPNTTGRHNYWHMQLTTKFARDQAGSCETTPAWLPTSTPAIPIDANNAPTCVVNLAVALYGAAAASALIHELEVRISREAARKLLGEIKTLNMGKNSG